MYTTTATKLSLVFIGYNHISSCSSFGGRNYWKCESQWLEGYINLMLALRLTLLYQTAVLNMVDHPLCNQTRQYCTCQYCTHKQTNKYSLCSCWCSVMHISIYFNCMFTDHKKLIKAEKHVLSITDPSPPINSYGRLWRQTPALVCNALTQEFRSMSTQCVATKAAVLLYSLLTTKRQWAEEEYTCNLVFAVVDL